MRPQDPSFPDSTYVKHCDDNPRNHQDNCHRRCNSLDASATQLIRDVYRRNGQSLLLMSANLLEGLLCNGAYSIWKYETPGT